MLLGAQLLVNVDLRWTVRVVLWQDDLHRDTIVTLPCEDEVISLLFSGEFYQKYDNCETIKIQRTKKTNVNLQNLWQETASDGLYYINCYMCILIAGL